MDGHVALPNDLVAQLAAGLLGVLSRVLSTGIGSAFALTLLQIISQEKNINSPN